jgi:multiple sugar transport system ATP-binding protein
MVFQNYALYPHMTVAENMGFALRMAKMKASERRRKVEDAARMLGLTEYLDRKPRALWGGQRQRVAMGRAIVRDPAVFCMDEPLSNLDAKMRVQTRTDIATLQHDLGVTTVYVTHDQVEAMTMGDRVAVLQQGELQQVDEPLALYDRPANLFVAGFIGSPRMNLLPAHVSEGVVSVGGGEPQVVLPVSPAIVADRSEVTVGIRPEGLELVSEGTPGSLAIETTLIEQLGADSFVHGQLTLDGEQQLVIVRAPVRVSARPGSVLHVRPEAAALHVFDTASGVRLSD